RAPSPDSDGDRLVPLGGLGKLVATLQYPSAGAECSIPTSFARCLRQCSVRSGCARSPVSHSTWGHFAAACEKRGAGASGGPRVCSLSRVQVSFSYPRRTGVCVLDDVTLDVKAGALVALCGSSGAGKSTLAALLGRFYEPTNGCIRLDGVPLSEL